MEGGGVLRWAVRFFLVVSGSSLSLSDLTKLSLSRLVSSIVKLGSGELSSLDIPCMHK